MFAAQGKTKHLNATNTVIIHTVDLDKEKTETGVFYAPLFGSKFLSFDTLNIPVGQSGSCL